MSHWYSTACLNNHLFLFFSQLFSRLSSFFPPISFSWQLQSSPLSFLSSLAFHFILLSHSLSSSLLFFLFFFSIGANPFNPPAFLPPFSCHIFARRRTVWIWVRVLKWSRDLFAKTPRTSEKQRYLPFPLSFLKLKNTYVWGVGGPNLCHSGCSLHTFCFHFLRIQKTWPSLKGKKSVFSSPSETLVSDNLLDSSTQRRFTDSNCAQIDHSSCSTIFRGLLLAGSVWIRDTRREKRRQQSSKKEGKQIGAWTRRLRRIF